MHVIAYVSHHCSDAEAEYGSSEGELLALVFAVTKFHHYLAVTVFTIVMDNGALQLLETHRQGSPKLTLWAMLLLSLILRFDITQVVLMAMRMGCCAPDSYLQMMQCP